MGGEATMTPVIPPIRKFDMKPSANSMGGWSDTDPRHIVPIQLKNFTPVGTAIRNDSREKNGSSTAPVANMWCAHTAMDSAPIPMVAKTRPLYPNIGLRENTGMISLTTPKNGIAMMYTSGWPKNQKRCCHKIAPPFEAS